MSQFSLAYSYLHKIEKGIVTDTGGYTVNGISTKAHPDYDFDNTSFDKEYDFFCDKYWLPMNCHLIFSQRIANEVFEQGVNCGTRLAQTWLQWSVNRLYTFLQAKYPNRYKDIEHLKIDGIIGSKTAKAVNNLSQYHDVLYYLTNHRQYMYYDKLVTLNPEKYMRYMLGWMNKRIAN